MFLFRYKVPNYHKNNLQATIQLVLFPKANNQKFRSLFMVYESKFQTSYK
jgi:hypothetical protein